MSEDGMEQKYVMEAFDTNWVVPLGPNVNGFEKDLEEFVSLSPALPKREGGINQQKGGGAVVGDGGGASGAVELWREGGR